MDEIYGRSLQTIALEFGRINVVALTWLLERSPRLKELTVSRVGYGDRSIFPQYIDPNPKTAKSVARIVFETLTRYCQGLRVLHLIQSFRFDDVSQQDWVEWMTAQPKLEELSIDGVTLEGLLF